MGGLAREYREQDRAGLAYHWLDVAERGGMPLDPRLWKEGPIGSSYPACMAQVAAAEQGEDLAVAYLRAVREGLMCFRRKLDTPEALVEEARRAGLDVERFRIDLGSNATVERFGADLDVVRHIPSAARDEQGAAVEDRDGNERLTFPSLCFTGEDGLDRWVFGVREYERYRDTAEAAGAAREADAPLDALDALRRFGRMATREVAEVCGLPGPRSHAELWRLAAEWQVRPVPVLTGYLWEPA
jgi:hypothetical protein